MRYKIRPVKTDYWRSGTNYLQEILKATDGVIEDKDIIIVSEKAISTSKGNLVDESRVKPTPLSYFLATFWMRIMWGFILGRLCRFKPESVMHFRNYPVENGARHKQLAFRYAGILQSLKHASEGGIDISNLPYSYACLPLKNPSEEAFIIAQEIKKATKKNATIIIADTDSTFTFRNFHFSARNSTMSRIRSIGGVIAFIIGRALSLRQRATPLASSGAPISVEEALELSEIAHHKRGYGIGRTVYDSAKTFNVEPDKITWDMLNSVPHYPIVIARRG